MRNLTALELSRQRLLMGMAVRCNRFHGLDSRLTCTSAQHPTAIGVPHDKSQSGVDGTWERPHGACDINDQDRPQIGIFIYQFMVPRVVEQKALTLLPRQPLASDPHARSRTLCWDFQC